MSADPRSWPLGARIGVALVAAALVPMAVLAYFSLDAGREAVERAQLDSVEGSATEAAVAVREYLGGVAARADALGTRPDVVAFLAAGGIGDVPDLTDASSPDVASVALVNAAGTTVAAAGGTAVGSDVSSTGWFADAVVGRATVAPVDLDTAAGTSTVTVAAPARNPGSGVQGVASIDVRGLDVLGALNQVQLAAGGQAWLVDGAGVVVMARDSRVVGRTLDDLGLGSLQAAADAGPLGTLTGVDLVDRGPQVVAFNQVQPGLVAVVLQPEAVFLGPVERLGTITWLLFAVVGLVAVGGALLLARRLSRRVGVLSAAAARIELDEPPDADALAVVGRSGDDVGQLARVFARMAEQVAAREKRLREQVRSLTIEIDEERRRKAVSEVTDTDFFRDLQGRAAEMRRRARGEGASPDGPATDGPSPAAGDSSAGSDRGSGDR